MIFNVGGTVPGSHLPRTLCIDLPDAYCVSLTACEHQDSTARQVQAMCVVSLSGKLLL